MDGGAEMINKLLSRNAWVQYLDQAQLPMQTAIRHETT